MISQQTIEHIQQVADIVEVVSDFVPLKRKGQNMMACCPFHNEKSPSFSVSPGKGIYKCFGCGKAGDSIRFVMDIESLSYIEAIRYLAAKYNIVIEEDRPVMDEGMQQAQHERESLMIALTWAKSFYQKRMLENEDGRLYGLSYFRERGFHDKTLAAFELGYAPDAWREFTDAALKAGFSLEILQKAGLTIVKEEGKMFDRFRGRVIFPIHNVTGKTIAFGARILKPSKDQPKYLNSPETEVYHKSKSLYGIFQAKNAIRNEDNCYLVEGYTDVISLNQAGIENVVASSGTSLTDEQIKLIARYTENITVLYDGDTAGIKASLRGIDMILEAGLNVRVVTFPEGQDPDSFVRKVGTPAFKEHIKKTGTDFITFKINLQLEEIGNDPIRKAGLIRDIVESIVKIPDPIKRAVLYKQCSTLLGVEETMLISEGNKHMLTQQKQPGRPLQTRDRPASGGGAPNYPDIPFLPPPDDLFMPPGEMPEYVALPPVKEEVRKFGAQEREVVRMLISYSTLELEAQYYVCNYLLDETQEVAFQDPLLDKVLQIFKIELAKGAIPGTDFFLKHPDGEVQRLAIDLTTERHELSPFWFEKHKIITPHEKDNLTDAAFKTVLRLKQELIKKMVYENMLLLAKASETGNIEEQTRCMQIHTELKAAEREIAGHLGNVITS